MSVDILLKIPIGQLITKLRLIFFTNQNAEPHFEEDSTTARIGCVWRNEDGVGIC